MRKGWSIIWFIALAIVLLVLSGVAPFSEGKPEESVLSIVTTATAPVIAPSARATHPARLSMEMTARIAQARTDGIKMLRARGSTST
jgi:hypothetical protein